MAFGLPQGKDRPGGVLENGHSSYVHYIECWSMYGAAGLSSFSHGLISIFNGNIKHPVRRHALRPLLLAHGVGSSGVAAGKLEHGIKVVRPHGTVLHGPAEERCVESLGCILVCSRQFNPAK